MKRKLLASIIILQIFCQSVTAVTSTGASVDYIPASKNLGLGKINPAAKLDVNGQILIRGGNPGLGKILNSDASGKATWVSPSSLLTANADTLDGLNSLQFLRSDTTNKFSSGTLITDSGTRFDVNGNLSIADTDISLDGANTTFTQSTGNINLVPASAKDLTTTIASAGEFKINTNDLVFNGTNARVGIGTANPSVKLEVNGTIKGNVINGTSANFTNLNASSIINTGSTNFDKIIVTNNVNGATANFTTGNFTNVVISGIVNGTTSSFDADFTNGSVLFSNNQGVVSQDNPHLYWDSTNKRIALNHKQPDMAMDVNGAIAIRNINDGNAPGSLRYESAANVVTHNGDMSITFAKPSGTIDGDLILVFIADTDFLISDYTPPSGWTLIEKAQIGPADATKVLAYYKIASGEPSSYTFTSPNYKGYDVRLGTIMRYSNVDNFSPINTHAYTTGNASPTSITTAAVTTSVPNAKIIKFVAASEMCSSSCLTSPSGYGTLNQDFSAPYMDWQVSEKTQAVAGISDTNAITAATSWARFAQITIAITESNSPSPGPSFLPDPDSISTFFYLSNGGSASTNPGDLLVKTNVNNVVKTIGIIDFLDGQLTLPSSADMVDGMDSSSFLRSDSSDNYSAGTLTFNSATSLVMAAGSNLDINSTNVSIADTDITLDGANTTFTQSTGNIALVPATGKDLSTTVASGGEFKINTSDLVFNGSSAQLAIGKANPITKLDVNGTIHGSTINGANANFTAAANLSKLISSGSVNGSTANFTSANFTGTTNVSKLISSGVVNGHSANFTDLNASTVNFSALGVGTLTSTAINNSGAISTAKLISSGAINGTTANLTKVLASGSVNGTDANFTNLIVSTLVNGNSFDGNFTNGSILFANNQGVISQDNSHLYWDRANNKLAIGRASADEMVTVNGDLAIRAASMPSATANYGKIYIDSSNSRPYYQDDGGNTYSILNGALASLSSPGGANTNFQFNDNGVFGGNGALNFIKASKTLEVANDAPLDINSTTVSIADTNISFNSPSGVTFTPSAGQNLNIALATTGDFMVNNNQLYLDTSAARLGIMTNNPNEVLTVGGVLSIKEGSAPSATADFGKIYVKSSDSKLYFKNDSGTEYDLVNPSVTSSIDELTDATTYNNSGCMYLGSGSGVGGSMFNTAVGIDALHSNVDSTYLTAMGYKALYANTNGTLNTAFGAYSLYSDTGSSSNVAVGMSSLYSNIDAYYNNAVGAYSLYSNVTGIENNALGYQALYSNTNGDANIAIGAQALRSNISGNGNIAVGNSSLYNIRNGNYNTAIGTQSLYTSRDSFYNTAFGYRTLYSLKHGNYNSAFGPGAISSLVNGSYNISFGYEAGKRATPNPANLYTSNGIHLGYQAGLNDGGDNNIFIGYEAGNGSVTGSSNIIIGYNNNLPPSPSASNQLDIADTIYGDLSNHNLGIDTASIDTKLEVNGSMMVTTLVNKSFYTNSSANNVTIDWNNGNKQIITLGHNVTFSFTAPSYGVGLFTLILLQDGSGTRTAAWPVSTKWAGGIAPSLSTAPGSVDIVTCLYTGSNYLCQMGLKFG